MKLKSLFKLFAVLALATLSAAQDGAASALQGSLVDAVGLPGQGWTSIGNQSPIEHNNFYLQSYVEQSAAVYSTFSGSVTFSPYAPNASPTLEKSQSIASSASNALSSLASPSG